MKLRAASLDKDAMCHPLTGGCGLKPHTAPLPAVRAMSPPHGGVWIETPLVLPVGVRSPVTPSRGGVD